MSLNKITVFLGRNKSVIEDLCSEIMKYTDISCSAKKYLDIWTIDVEFESDKDMVLLAGNMILASKDYNINDINWVDANGKSKNINENCILKLTFDGKACDKSCYLDYINKLKAKLEKVLVAQIEIVQDFFTYYFYISITDIIPITFIDDVEKLKRFFDKYDDLLKAASTIVSSYKFLDPYNPANDYYSIEFYKFNGTLFNSIHSDSLNELTNLKEYFSKSSLIVGLFKPIGLTIANKQGNFDNSETIWAVSTNRNLKEFEIVSSYYDEENHIALKSKATVYYDEEYSNKEKLVITDDLDITTKIVKVSNTLLLVVSEANCKRKAKGKKLNVRWTVYDRLYGKHPYEDCEFTYKVADYYELIDLNLLLHYTENSKYYETYEVPIGFEFKQGIDFVKKSKTLYDEYHKDWIYYDDISKVKEKLLKTNKQS